MSRCEIARFLRAHECFALMPFRLTGRNTPLWILRLCTFCLPQGLKHCSVLLDRFHTDDEAVKKESEEKEDMNRKGGKPVSRIPTFQKRPVSGSQSTELPAPKKDAPVHAAQPPEKTASGSVEASKSKPPDVRETALPSPMVRVPKVGYEAPSMFDCSEQTTAAGQSPAVSAPRSWALSESLQSPLMTASPRPALRPEEDTSKTSETEADPTPDAPASYLPSEGSLSQKPQQHAKIALTASGDTAKSAENVRSSEVSQVEAIMDEEPPWETEPVEIAELKDSRSSSDAECEGDSADERSEGHMEEQSEPFISQSEFPNLSEKKANTDDSPSTVVPEEPAKVSSAKSTRVSYVAIGY